MSPTHVRLRPSRDGSALARLGGADGVPFELRVASIGGRKDPGRNADALTTLEHARVALVPRLYGRGEIAGASWTSESVLEGTITRHLTRAIVADVVSLCLQLPRGDHATSLRDRMVRLRDRYPRWGPVAIQLAEQATPTAPAVVQHGDLWSGNLLASGGRLSGVVDWDTWHPAGLPGVDLLHLFSMQQRERTGKDIGGLWLSGVWRSPEFLAATSDYWRAIGIRPGPDLLEAIGLDWWAGQVFKRQTFAEDPSWVERNIDAVLDAVSGRR
jgi:Phosphotransferase enzyme family